MAVAIIRSLIVVLTIISYYTYLHSCCRCCFCLAFHFAFTLNSHSTNNRKGSVSPWEYRLLMAIDNAIVLADDDQIDSNATRRDDMYGIGVALMEIITGKPMWQIGEDVHYGLLTQWVSSMFEEGEIGSIVDPKLKGEFDINSVEEALKIAMNCVSQNSAHHPTMDQLVLKLQQCLQIERARLSNGGQPFVS